jgi:hypothetical protein
VGDNCPSCICFDNELCLRAWMNDYQVGYSFVPFKGPAGHYAAGHPFPRAETALLLGLTGATAQLLSLQD